MNTSSKKICVVGTGYVGLTTGVCLASLGHEAICVDKAKKKIAKLSKGNCTIHEPGLEKMLVQNLKRLTFTTALREACQKAEFIFIAVGTPGMNNGAPDLSALEEVIKQLLGTIETDKIVVIKSTVPIGTSRRIEEKFIKAGKAKVEVLSNPEFLRQGKAVKDTLNPDRILIGGSSKTAIAKLRSLYKKISAPIVVTTFENAEIIKYASNSFLAMKISYINEVANLCEKYGANVKEVAKGMGLDPRIGDRFLEAGIGFGGSCFPKDMKALAYSARSAGYAFRLLEAALEVNERQKTIAIEKLKKYLGKIKGRRIGLLGLTFKPDTDDIREASSISLISRLLKEKAIVRAYDPKGEENMKMLFRAVHYCDSPYEVASKSDAIILVTEWDEFKGLDFRRIRKSMRGKYFIDGRNLLDPKEMTKQGFVYEGIGRK